MEVAVTPGEGPVADDEDVVVCDVLGTDEVVVVEEVVEPDEHASKATKSPVTAMSCNEVRVRRRRGNSAPIEWPCVRRFRAPEPPRRNRDNPGRMFTDPPPRASGSRRPLLARSASTHYRKKNAFY
jgi:hypothetical protein